jgi:hypothetical protein
MTKARITTDGNIVTLACDDEINGRQEREFFTLGAYVYERINAVKDRQVCDRLQSRGSTLMHHDRPLIDVIRREYRAMRRAEARDAARY